MALAAAIFSAFFLLYFSITWHLAPIFLSAHQAPFFGADTLQLYDAMKWVTFDGDMRKHLLFSASTAPIVDALAWLLRVEERTAILLTLSALAAANAGFAWYLIERFAAPRLLSLAIVAAYCFAFSNLLFFNIPETYSLSNLAILFFFWLFLSGYGSNSPVAAAIMGAGAGFAGLFNPPLLSLVVVPWLRCWLAGSPARAIRYGAIAASVMLLVFCLPYAAIHGRQILDFTARYGSQWASLLNLLDIEKIAIVALSFSAFAIVSPSSTLADRLTLQDTLNYLDRPLALATLALFGCLAALAAREILRSRDPLVLPVTAWVACLFCFYVYFNPAEALLYSPQIMFPLTLLLARGLARHPLDARMKTAMVASFAVLLALSNVPVLYRLPV